MGEYLVEVEGKYNLEEINLQIRGEEAGASEFISSSVCSYEGRTTNIAKFRELAPGTVPKEITLVPQGHSPPEGAKPKPIWTGEMIISGTKQAVSAYRRV
jgi:hypothetical protein